MKLESALEELVQLCSALSSAHTSGSTLRDMKPEFAKPAYMSPEECRGEALDVRSDIYSLGCIMYEVLTGMPPLVGPSVEATIAKQLSEAPLSPISVEPGIPEKLDAIVLKCLEKAPADRFQSVEQVLIELNQFPRAVPLAPAPSAPPPASPKPVHNKLRMFAVPFAVVVVIAILLGCAVAYNAAVTMKTRAVSAEHADSIAPSEVQIEHMPPEEIAPQEKVR